MRPGLEVPDWDEESSVVTVIDPFYNRIKFCERNAK